MNLLTKAVKSAVYTQRRSLIWAGCRKRNQHFGNGTTIEQAAEVAECCERVAAEILAELVREGSIVFNPKTARFVEPLKNVSPTTPTPDKVPA